MVKEGKKSEGFGPYILMHQFYNWLIETDKMGPRNIHMNHMINLQKIGTPFFVTFLMLYFQNFSQAIWVYLGFHGTYGIAWQIKDSVFPDQGFQKKVSFCVSLVLYALILGPYCMGSVLIATGQAWQEIPKERVTLAFYYYALGLIMVFCADCQKYYILQLKRGLIDNGFFKYTRNPNYLGQIMIYFSFALLVNEPLFYGINLFAWMTLFVSQMKAKDRSFAQKEGWEEYERRSWMLLFKINGSAILSFFTYAILAGATGYAIYMTGGMNIIPKSLL